MGRHPSGRRRRARVLPRGGPARPGSFRHAPRAGRSNRRVLGAYCDAPSRGRAQLQPTELRYDFPAAGAEAIPWVRMQPPTKDIQGLVAAESPACTVANWRETARRFTLARALGDYLGRTAQGPAILSGLATDRQAQSRAFAAEFLVPAEALRRELRSNRIPLDDVDDLADEFGVSSYVVRHQIENHNLAQIADW